MRICSGSYNVLLQILIGFDPFPIKIPIVSSEDLTQLQVGFCANSGYVSITGTFPHIRKLNTHQRCTAFDRFISKSGRF